MFSRFTAAARGRGFVVVLSHDEEKDVEEVLFRVKSEEEEELPDS